MRIRQEITVTKRVEPDNTHEDPQADIPDFTPEQWAWIQERSRQWEENYVPTSSLFPMKLGGRNSQALTEAELHLEISHCVNYRNRAWIL